MEKMTLLKSNNIFHKSDDFLSKILEKDFQLFPNIFSQIFFYFDQNS